MTDIIAPEVKLKMADKPPRKKNWFDIAMATSAVLCLLSASVITWYTLSVCYRLRNWPPVPPPPAYVAPPATDPPKPLTPEQKVQLQVEVEQARSYLIAEIRANDSNQRAVLDRLLTLIGAYSTILGLTAFFTLRSGRDDAKSQIEGARGDLDAFKTKVKEEWEDFKKDVWSELPEMRKMKQSLQELMLELEVAFSDDRNWNTAKAYNDLSAQQKQDILVGEGMIHALHVFISPTASSSRIKLASLYQSLARFYFSKFHNLQLDDDGEKAYVYAREAIKLDESAVSGYRLCGAICLGLFRIRGGEKPMLEDRKLAALLQEAENTLRVALIKDPKDLGTLYNLALAISKRQRYNEAAELSLKTIEDIKDFPPSSVGKYMKSVFANSVCFLARSSYAEGNADEKKRLVTEAFDTLKKGLKFFKADPAAAAALRASVSTELQEGKDLAGLSDEDKERIREMIAPASS